MDVVISIALGSGRRLEFHRDIFGVWERRDG